MAQQISNSTEQLHELFHQYLMGKLEDAEDVRLIQETAEEVLPYTLNEYFGTGFATIYDLQDESQIESLRRKIKAHAMLKGIDQRAEPRYTEVLKWYRLFLKSLHSETTPLQMPGELDYEEDDEHSYVAAEGLNPQFDNDEEEYAPDTEGVEHQYNLTKKERNPELRHRCIEFYKKLWGGHIHCICCGFDFGKAYGSLGEDYIEIHHVNPHHSFEGEHTVDPTKDLIPLCSNCHSMIHRVPGQGECMTLEELKEQYKGIKYIYF